MRDRRAFLPIVVVGGLVAVAFIFRGADIPEAPVVPDVTPTATATTTPPDPHADLYAATNTAVRAWQAGDVEDVAVPDFPPVVAEAPQAPVDALAVRVDADGMAAVDVRLDDGTRLDVVMALVDGRWFLLDVAPGGGNA